MTIVDGTRQQPRTPTAGNRRTDWSNNKMLYMFGFERLGVVLADLYFVDPAPTPGQEGAERGVRLELRMLDRPPVEGSIYAAQPIAVGRPLWRVDLLETADGPYGTFDRTHHHPVFDGWEPGSRHFEPALSADPLGWLAAELHEVGSVLSRQPSPDPGIPASDCAALRKCVPEIVAAAERLLQSIRHGELAAPEYATTPTSARVGWL